VKIFGLTGGIASGKSEVAQRLAAQGIPVIDADAVGHELIEPSGRACDAVLGVFGPTILTCGKIDREKLGAQVFADPDALQELNRIVHPILYDELRARCSQFEKQGAECVVIDAAIIADSGKQEDWLDGLILVTAPRALRLERLVSSRGLDEKRATDRIDAQVPAEAKMSLADWVVVNDGPLDALYAQADALAEELLHDATR